MVRGLAPVAADFPARSTKCFICVSYLFHTCFIHGERLDLQPLILSIGIKEKLMNYSTVVPHICGFLNSLGSFGVVVNLPPRS